MMAITKDVLKKMAASWSQHEKHREICNYPIHKPRLHYSIGQWQSGWER
jgi:hypothetical protein